MKDKIPSVSQSMEKLVDEIHGIAGGYVPTGPIVGIVLAPPPNIQVKINNIVLTKEDVYIAHYLLIGYERTAKGVIKSATQDRAGGSGEAAFSSHNHDINNPYTDNIIYTDTLKPGDLVSVLPMKGSQLYIITDKLVKL